MFPHAIKKAIAIVRQRGPILDQSLHDSPKNKQHVMSAYYTRGTVLSTNMDCVTVERMEKHDFLKQMLIAANCAFLPERYNTSLGQAWKERGKWKINCLGKKVTCIWNSFAGNSREYSGQQGLEALKTEERN